MSLSVRAAIVGAVLAVGCNHEPTAPPEMPPPKVTVMAPVAREVQDAFEYSGRTEAVETVQIRTRVVGFLEKINFTEGADVKAGDLLYEIDPRTYQADLASVEAEVARQEANVKEATQLALNAEALLKRNATGAEDVVQKDAARDQAKASLLKAKAAVETARLNLSFTKIYAPIGGRISRTLVTKGNLVGYGESTLLTTIVKLDPLYAYFDGSERKSLEYDKLVRENGAAEAVGGKVKVLMSRVVDKGFPFEGYIDFRENQFDPNTGTIRVRGVFPNKDGQLQPGMFVRIKVPFGHSKPRLLVPDTAISADQRGRYLLLVGEGNKVDYRPVAVAGTPQEDGMVVIAEGLKGGERVIVNGLQRAVPGRPVSPEDAKPADGKAKGSDVPSARTTEPAEKKAEEKKPEDKKADETKGDK